MLDTNPLAVIARMTRRTRLEGLEGLGKDHIQNS